jgi:hypothetical protein
VILPLALAAATAAFAPLAPGVEYGRVLLDPKPERGDGVLHVVRIDPALARLDFALASRDGKNRAAGAWAEARHFLAAINAGMFKEDHRGNVGYLKQGDHVNNGHWNKTYESVLVFDPIDGKRPGARILDRDAPGFADEVAGYRAVVQNLRLIKGPGVNVWKPNGRRWTESAVAMDKAGRILFLFSRTPFEMADFVERLLASPLGITHAMHVEGGPEASLSVRAGRESFDLAGSYESRFFESDANQVQWPVPNVLGVRAPKGAKDP